MFLRNVSNALKEGGYFIGCSPDGAKIVQYLGDKEEYLQPLLRLRKGWIDPTRPYGNSYTFAINDTVTHEHEDNQGSAEFLVFSEVFFSPCCPLRVEGGYHILATVRRFFFRPKIAEVFSNIFGLDFPKIVT